MRDKARTCVWPFSVISTDLEVTALITRVGENARRRKTAPKGERYAVAINYI